MNERTCLTCSGWVRSPFQKDIGYCRFGEAHPVQRLRFQFESCEDHQFLEQREPSYGDKVVVEWLGKKHSIQFMELTK